MTFDQVMPQLRAGKKIKRRAWPHSYMYCIHNHVYLKNGMGEQHVDEIAMVHLMSDDWIVGGDADTEEKTNPRP